MSKLQVTTIALMFVGVMSAPAHLNNEEQSEDDWVMGVCVPHLNCPKQPHN